MMGGDSDLLRQYVRERSEDAFAALVQRHLPLVYSAALRQVRSSQVAEEVSQTVFVELARSAHQLNANTVLSAWLYTVTCRKAIDAVRRESRRQVRERLASEMLDMNTKPDEWAEIEPLLDEAMRELDETDRAVILLRYFENKPLRQVGTALGISEDAAQKRTARAIDRLRDFFSKRAVTIHATALTAAISTHAVTAAPAALVAAISKAASVGIAGGITGAATKGLTMTALQKTIAGAAIIVAAGAGVYHTQQTAGWREKLNASEQRSAELVAQLEELGRERDEALAQAAEMRSENAQLAIANTRMATQPMALPATEAAAGSATAQAAVVEAKQASESDGDELGRQLGHAVVRGEPGALDQLRELSRATTRSFTTNRTGLNDQQRQALHRQTFGPMRAGFGVIEAAAMQGNEIALRAIADAAQLPELKDRAVSSLGKLAGKGDENALNALLQGEHRGFHRSSIVSALRPAAESGNQRAIDALAAVARDPGATALWYMAADGLGSAAESGNAVAVDALAHLSFSATNKSVYNAVLSGLQRAAHKGNPTAAETLRSMGLR